MSRRDSGRTRAGKHGFTLLELSIVLVLIGIIIGMGLVTLTGSLQASQFNATAAKMDAIEKALLDYSIANSRIPCPSDLTQISSSATYGFEAGAGVGSTPATATGACTGASMVPVANFKSASGTVEGGVPTRALQLPNEVRYKVSPQAR
jgi:prepilin-type N-terminal cleavage/methylation domain-containing protein